MNKLTSKPTFLKGTFSLCLVIFRSAHTFDCDGSESHRIITIPWMPLFLYFSWFELCPLCQTPFSPNNPLQLYSHGWLKMISVWVICLLNVQNLLFWQMWIQAAVFQVEEVLVEAVLRNKLNLHGLKPMGVLHHQLVWPRTSHSLEIHNLKQEALQSRTPL